MAEAWHGEEVPTSEPNPTPRRRWGVWLIGLVVLAAAGVGAWLWLRSKEEPPPAPVAAQPPPPAPAVPAASSVNIADGDALLRKLAPELSSAKELAAWLGQQDILRRLIAATSMVADGKTPSNILGFIRPSKKFEVAKKKKKIFASPKDAARYDLITRVITSIDPTAAGKAYAQLQPYIEAAYAEVGPKGKSFDPVMRAAIQRLTDAPPPPANAELVAKGVGYAYKDPKIEANTAARKQLWRMGAANEKAFQDWLNKMNAALPTPSAAPASPTASPDAGA